MNASRALLRRHVYTKSLSTICWRCQINRPRTYASATLPPDPYRASRSRSEHASLPPLGPASLEPELRENGVPGLYGPVGLDNAWYKYQDDLITKLNDWLSRGESAYLGKDNKSIAIATARLPQYAALFNYASMAYNNNFYFQGINLDGTQSPISRSLDQKIAKSFQSVDNLREEMLATAHAMFGPGFVWLVEHDDKQSSDTYAQRKLSILTTYMAGTPFSAAHNRFQPHDMNTQPQDAMMRDPRYAGAVSNSAGAFGHLRDAQNKRRVAYGGVDVTPVLCVNTWPMAWMFDFDVTSLGKWAFLQSWWDRVNWEVVERRVDLGSGRSRLS